MGYDSVKYPSEITSSIFLKKCPIHFKTENNERYHVSKTNCMKKTDIHSVNKAG